MDHVSPPDRCRYVELLGIVRHYRPIESVLFTFFLQSFDRVTSDFRLIFGLSDFHVGIEDQKECGSDQHDKKEEEVFY